MNPASYKTHPSAALTLRNVTKRFNGAAGCVTALDDITLDVKEGEFLVLVGPSGCGKSTLLSLLAGLDQVDEGAIRLGEEPVRSPGRDRLVMFQQDALFPWLNALENVMFGLRLKPDLTEAERLESARYYLSLVGLADKEKARPHELSGGMRQRVALARSLAPNPRVLLMDEPFSALDALTRDQLYRDIQDIFTKRKKTIVLVTHNIREAVCLGDRVVLLSPNPGRVRQIFDINLPRPRRINDPELASLAAEVTDALSSHLSRSQEGLA
ncbi:MAG: ABC transporter ATP-binding protein [Verrucomicrobiota bacterium]|jgi:NitT/TauT family transport system ATP-binding protein|nr:MAG: ABC transporter ATP-binding protein [Opitutales bacterium]